MYLIALLAPPLAVLSSGKPFQAVFNVVLLVPALLALLMTVVGFGFLAFPFWFLAAGHAVLVVHGHHADARTKRLVRATAAAGQTAARAVDAAAAQARATSVTLLPAAAAAPASPPPALPAPAAGEPAGVTVPASLVAPGKRPKLPCARCGQHVRAVVTAGALACPYCGGPVGA